MTFYRKYRGQTLKEIDLTEVRETLTKIIATGNIPHAFLFSGPKGTGKTSAARILAKIVNCESTTLALRGPRKIEPCNECDQCVSIMKGTNIDVIELDAASNRGIDDIRTLRDAVKLSPARAKKKVYIIDEAHMLTTEASNALLKTLEEPPEHVIFILATTNPEKLIETIRSRAVNILFKRGTTEEIKRSLERVVKGEKIKIDEKALELIAEKSEGSFRDAQKNFEQLISEVKPLNAEGIEEFLFHRGVLNIDEIIANLSKKDTKASLNLVENSFQKGASMENLISELLSKFRSALLAKVGIGGKDLKDFTKEDLILLIELFSRASFELKSTVIEQLPVEMAIIEWCEGGKGEQSQFARLDPNSPVVEGDTGSPSSHSRASRPTGGTSTLDSASENLAQTKDSGSREQSTAPKVRGEVKEISEEVWRKILAGVKPINSVVEALLRAAKPMEFDGKTLILGVFYRFHKERLEAAPHRKILEDVVGTLIGEPVRIVCRLTEPPKEKIVEEKSGEPKESGETILTEGGDKDIIKIAEEVFGN